MKKIIAETERLIIRELEDSDAINLVRLNENPNVTRYTGDGQIDLAEADKILQTRVYFQYRAYGVGRVAVVEKNTGRFLGWSGLKYHPEQDEYDLGYRFFEEDWGKGYATESARAMIEWGRKTLGSVRIVAKAFPANTASIAVMKKLGMVYEKEEDDPLGKMVVYVLPL